MIFLTIWIDGAGISTRTEGVLFTFNFHKMKKKCLRYLIGRFVIAILSIFGGILAIPWLASQFEDADHARHSAWLMQDNCYSYNEPLSLEGWVYYALAIIGISCVYFLAYGMLFCTKKGKNALEIAWKYYKTRQTH